MDTANTESSHMQPTLEAPDHPRQIAHSHLYEYITMLLSGLVALGLLIGSGYALLDYWLGQANTTIFSSYVYDFYLYLELSLVFFAALHLVMLVRSRSFLSAESDAAQQTARTFLAIFLTILVLVVTGSLVTLAFIAKTNLLGTTDYSTKGLWQTILGPTQAAMWAGLVWWYFKPAQGRSVWLYVVIAGGISLAVALLLFLFPTLARRDGVIDERTTSDLYSISASINSYAGNRGSLPEQLSQLQLDEKVKSRLANYEYKRTQTAKSPAQYKSGNGTSGVSLDQPTSVSLPSFPSDDFFSYQLCASFKTDTSSINRTASSVLNFAPASGEFGSHKKGKQCFNQTAYSIGTASGVVCKNGVC